MCYKKIRNLSLPRKLAYSFKIKENIVRRAKNIKINNIEKISKNTSEYCCLPLNTQNVSYKTSDVFSLDNYGASCENNTKNVIKNYKKSSSKYTKFEQEKKDDNDDEVVSKIRYTKDYVSYICMLIQHYVYYKITEHNITRNKEFKNVTKFIDTIATNLKDILMGNSSNVLVTDDNRNYIDKLLKAIHLLLNLKNIIKIKY